MRALRWILIALAMVLAMPVAAVQPDEVLDDPVLEGRAREISKGLRCLVCRNESIDESNADLAKDLRVLVPVVVVVMALLLAWVFRSPGGVLVPLAQVVLVLIWTLGLMGWLGVPITLVTTLLPVVLMTVTVLDEMHLLVRLRSKRRPGSEAPLAPAVDAALGEIARPVVSTSVTSALAFLSFLSASLPPVRDFGIFAAVGTLIAMMLPYSVAFIVLWSSFFFIWVFLLGLPVGPSTPTYYSVG